MEKVFYDHNDVAQRYGCGRTQSYYIIRSIKEVNSGSPRGGALGPGKVLASELEYWEANRGRRAE